MTQSKKKIKKVSKPKTCTCPHCGNKTTEDEPFCSKECAYDWATEYLYENAFYCEKCKNWETDPRLELCSYCDEHYDECDDK